MRTKVSSITLMALMAGILLILVLGVANAESAIIYVPDDYSIIQ